MLPRTSLLSASRISSLSSSFSSPVCLSFVRSFHHFSCSSLFPSSGLFTLPRRFANKEQFSKDKAKMKKKKEKEALAKSPKSSLVNDGASDPLIQRLMDKCEEITAKLNKELAEIQVGRVASAAFDSLPVSINGKSHSLSSLASIVNRSAQLIAINLFDSTNTKEVEKALKTQTAKQGFTLQIDSPTAISIVLPKSTKESRKEISKDIVGKAENYRVQIRAQRQNSLHSLKALTLTEEEKEQVKTKIQAIVDGTINDIEKIIKEKEKQILEE
jgi:ribosome recycling factor